MKSTKMKKNLSGKKRKPHKDQTNRANMKMKLHEAWSNLMASDHKKLSEGASEFSRAIRSRGGSNSKISGRELHKGHHLANRPIKKQTPKK